MQDQPATSYVDTYSPPAGAAPATPASSAATPATAPAEPSKSTTVSQSLEDQNIFFLLGVEDGSDEEKEAFLDELQQVIWEDFLERDVELLITEEELQGMKKIMAQKEKSDLQLQEEIVVYLEKLIPDLEDILLEKALELKEDMVRERVSSMRELAAGKTEVLAKLDQAEAFIKDNQWRAAAEVLNGLPA